MMEREVVERFLNKYIGVVRSDNGTDFFSKGKFVEITKESIIIEFRGQIQAISINSIINIREIEGEPMGSLPWTKRQTKQ